MLVLRFQYITVLLYLIKILHIPVVGCALAGCQTLI